nr:T7SS effector LXG polymorphic toxin [Bacillus swezeyi]
MKIYEAKTLISSMEARSDEYKKTREQFVNLKKAFQGMADLGNDFQGEGADNIKNFYKEHARNVDEWLDMIDMQIAFLDSIAAALEEADLSGSTFVDTSFLENELEIAYKKSNAVVAEQKQALKTILEDIKDIVALEVFSTADFKQHISDSKVKRENTVDKVNEMDFKLKKEYEKSEENQDYIEARSKALIDATGKGKNATPVHFNAKAYYDTKVFKQRDKIHKKTQEYLTIKKEEAEQHRVKELKEKLAKVSDPDEYLEIAKEIGYENLTPDQKQYVLQLEQFKQQEDIVKGIGVGLKDVAVDTATGIWDTVTHPIETLEGIGHTIMHPVDTFNVMKKGIEESYERDVVNGDSYSRSRWFTYAIGMVGTSIVGTKGADKVSKVSKAGKVGQATAKANKASKKVAGKTVKASKEAVEKSVASFKKSMQRVASKIKGIQIHNPFEPQVQLAGGGKVPYHAIDGENFKKTLIQRIEKVFGDEKGAIFDSDLIKKYIRDIEGRTGRELPKNQIEKLKEALRNKRYQKLTPSETRKHRRTFNKVKDKLIEEWERKTGQKWPTYSKDVISEKTGEPVRRKGDKYDAHHIIENSFRGEHEWWNIHPAKFPNEHQSGIHGTGSPANKLFKGGK